MKALSIRQPWAWLIVNGHKDIENRDWATKFRGLVLIHASKGMTRDEYEDCKFVTKGLKPALEFPAFEALERGGIVGCAEITNCVTRSASPWFYGRYGFVLRGAEPLTFRAYKGSLGFFDVDEPGVKP